MILAIIYAYKSFMKQIDFDWWWMIGCLILDSIFVKAIIGILGGTVI